ncbi:hypothetical protein C0991_004723 [Blastosporella zonata]|nr:hypothetical protein C0991_004723 [Blastosporella zonata]
MAAAKVQDVLLVGFGAVGAMYALILKRSGLARVTIVARSNYDAVIEHGVRFESAKYGVITGWRPDRVVRSVQEAADRPYSYVFVTTKAIPERTSTPSILKPLISAPYPQPTYVLLQNGLNVETDLYHAIKELGKEPSIISTALWINTNLLEPNVVEHGIVDRVSIGMYRYNDFTTEANTPAEAAVLEDIGAILTAGGSEVAIVPEVQRKKFSKNFWNVAFSSFSTLTGSHKPSMLLDAEKGQAIEVEAILGAVVRLAQERGVAVPRVEMLYALLLVVQNQLLAKLESSS